MKPQALRGKHESVFFGNDGLIYNIKIIMLKLVYQENLIKTTIMNHFEELR